MWCVTMGYLRILSLGLLFSPLFLAALADEKPCATAICERAGRVQLSAFDVDPAPWSHLEDLGEQPVVYLGASPRELVLGYPLAARPRIPNSMKSRGENWARQIAAALGQAHANIQLEMWPSYDGFGYLTWEIARWRETPRHNWKWLDASLWKTNLLAPELPQILDARDAATNDSIFNPVPHELYDRPKLGRLIWTDATGRQILGSWLPPGQSEKYLSWARQKGLVAREVLPPARFNRDPITFVVGVSNGEVVWPDSIEWKVDHRPVFEPSQEPSQINEWPADLAEKYLEKLKILSGQTPIRSPLTGKVIRFDKLSVGQRDNELRDLVAYLKQYYEKLGFSKDLGVEFEMQSFTWHGIAQQNFIVKIKGTLQGKANKPVLFADHIDKAIAEDTFRNSGEKVRATTPGADDNGTATAALLTAAEILKPMLKSGIRPQHDIWLVHFTGEEYPGSSLGARYLAGELLKAKKEITALVVMDMLGFRSKGDPIFQINPGPSAESLALVPRALGATEKNRAKFQPQVQQAWSRMHSYLCQTDGAVFGVAGYPVVLFNEHMNLSRRVNPYYHQSNDLPEYIDIPYALAQVKTAIEFAARLAKLRE